MTATEPKRIPVDIVRVEEPWAIAYLADGTKVKVKLVFDQVTRELDADGKPAFAPNGEPLMHATWNWSVAVNAPDAAKKGQTAMNR